MACIANPELNAASVSVRTASSGFFARLRAADNAPRADSSAAADTTGQ